jgi:hypothetical protein
MTHILIVEKPSDARSGLLDSVKSAGFEMSMAVAMSGEVTPLDSPVSLRFPPLRPLHSN